VSRQQVVSVVKITFLSCQVATCLQLNSNKRDQVVVHVFIQRVLPLQNELLFQSINQRKYFRQSNEGSVYVLCMQYCKVNGLGMKCLTH
jgi:hypothetical protein